MGIGALHWVAPLVTREVLKPYAYEFAELQMQLSSLTMIIGGIATQWEQNNLDFDVKTIPHLNDWVEKWIREAERLCKELGLRSGYEAAHRLLYDKPWIGTGFPNRLKDLSSRIEDELKTVQFQLVPASKLGYYDQPFFGQAVEMRFSDSVDDIRAAGRCFALGCHAAAVLHCMGIVQEGLTQLADHLRIDIDIQLDDWNTIITKIEGAVSAARKIATGPTASREQKSGWAKSEPFYAEIITDVRAIKNAWRNPGFHFRRRDFDEPKAEKILRHVKDFMCELAAKLPPDKI